MQEKTLTICGLSSVRAVAAQTPDLIGRLFFDDACAPLFAETCRYLAQHRKIYRMVTGDELRKITDTAHHQGAAAVLEVPALQMLDSVRLTGHTLCLYDVENPHNVGAIVRTAAFFGAQQIIVSQKTYAAAMTAAAWRVAEGGMTHLKLLVCEDAEAFFRWVKESSVRAVAAVRPEGKKMRTLGEFLRDKNTMPLVICLGNEEAGLPTTFVAQCAGRFSIPGSGKIESLNVSVTAALCLDALAAKNIV